jgi:beta-galactosidase GanA
MGVTVVDYQSIYPEKQGVRFRGPLAGVDADCQVWADILNPGGAEVLATYTAGSYVGKAAITSRVFGKGKTRRSTTGDITYLLNHTVEPQSVAGTGKDLLSGAMYSGAVRLDPYGVCILQSA